ncbi:MAG TPA: DegT/DnrJ/EryC1/StrS family aminotransferase [Candidatus Paceibacterota bacterium]|uniref:Polysaccharide biosynthesis protein n=1 Tax=Candidatus Giovannonibacteria bacterium RIFCSPLOWO2_01_FULL_46_32 TaxID=1798353 RepID=A0A1F5XGX6_9BACT|nr:MAG: hypothetical protein A3B19_01850 [Candidatus Giovannonibacteria bacterium RIFCSPLOWO2_01_FULL_46_32]
MKPIPLAGPDITSQERRAVLEVLKSPILSRGPKLYEFEKHLSAYVGRRYAVAVNSGTSALHLAIKAYNIGDGDHVITTPLSFIASSNCILFERAVPVFVDIKKDTYCIDPGLVEEKIKELKKRKKRVKAILAVDMFGYLADWGRLRALANRYNLILIEDSCEALGSYKKRRGEKRMAGSFGDVGIFGFYPNKQITTGEGGALLTNDKKIADLARAIRNHGASPRGRWSDYRMLGYNYHISDIHCALGTAQLKRIGTILSRKIRVAELYTKCLHHSSLIHTPLIPPAGTHLSHYIYLTRLADHFSREQRDLVIKKLQKYHIASRDYFPPIHLSYFYQKKFGYRHGDFPVAEYMMDHALALPFFNALTEKQIEYICTILQGILKRL